MSDDESAGDTGYQVAAKIDMKTIQEMDAEDESLQKYKAALLGNVGDACSPADDPRLVVIQSLHVIFKDGDTISYENLHTAEAVQAMKESTAATPMRFPEGSLYKIKVVFKVQHEIVAGLKYVNKVSRIVGGKKVKALTQTEMLGSYGPQEAAHEVVFPRLSDQWEQAPSGMIARGSYVALSRFVDDDKQTHLEFEYSFNITKK
eukprot:TRINITY_DN246_c0_g2_i1.p1 TRINITY_DN246_c0_g2~~TRINITY_DN246_c0_g2_i1.p1  ORF type:complete len:230 (-),score=76.75 TRINITY_DN246_c0_g2_i1:153-764(-)